MNMNKLKDNRLFSIMLVLIGSILLTICAEWDLLNNWADFVQKPSSNDFKNVVSYPLFRLSITYGFACLSSYHIWKFFKNFNINSFLIDIILCLALLLLTFHWITVLSNSHHHP